MNGFTKESDELKNQELLACERVINSGWYILGKELENFEQQWAKTNESKYAIGVANGMDAIEIILRSLDIKHEDEVITTSMTAFATVLAIIRSGATPVLADICPSTANLSIESVRRCITKNTKAVILVHLYGQISNMEQWQSFCEENRIHLIEDCAQAHFAEWNEKKSGNFGIAGAFSFYPTKNLGALGDAGAIVTSSQEIYEKSLRLRNYGQSQRYYHTEIGLNSRLDEIQAAILSIRLKYLSIFTDKRRYIAKQYQTKITNPKIEHMNPISIKGHVYHLYVIKSKFRNSLQTYLKNNDIETYIHYPIPIHLQNITSGLLKDKNGLINTEEHATNCLSLPCHPQMSNEDIEFVINKVNTFHE